MNELFHAGEQAAQARVGVREHMAAPGAASIRDWMPDQHRDFFAALPFVVVAALDGDGWPVASVLTGPAGFVSTPDARTLHIAAWPAPDDPAGAGLAAGAAFGMLGIDLATRRRNRANGRIISSGPNGIAIGVTQSFGNCPQYIQSRDLRCVPAEPAPAQRVAGLDPAARRMIVQADTFFVASSSGPAGDKQAGMDVSHRGGRPGFVRIDGDVLTVPDFAGNRYYNTLGNLLVYPKAGLLFIDFETGDMLHLAGETEIVWGVPEAERLEGAERLWRFRVVWGCRRPGALPFRWDFRSLSRGAARTGAWI